MVLNVYELIYIFNYYVLEGMILEGVDVYIIQFQLFRCLFFFEVGINYLQMI